MDKKEKNLGKVVKFPFDNNENQRKSEEKKQEVQKIKEEKSFIKDFGFTDFETSLRIAIEEYIKGIFAVREILGMDISYKENKNVIGFIGVMAYEHKRKSGTFVAKFIGEGWVDKNSGVKISEIAFEAGEPDLYISIYNTLKAKKVLPEINL